jgi:hypothetical protein
MPPRLLAAVEVGFASLLTHYGFVASGGGSERGETVECTNGTTLITVSADWLEGELSLTVRSLGGRPVPVDDLIDLTRIKGLHLTRLSRNVTTDVVAAQLEKIALALSQQVPGTVRAAKLSAVSTGLPQLAACHRRSLVCQPAQRSTVRMR